MANEKLARAIDHLNADELPGGDWAYYAPEAQRWYVVDRAGLEALHDYLEDDPRDGYSLWCASGHGKEMPATEVVSMIEIDISAARFVVPPRASGQIVERAYGTIPEFWGIIRRETDRSDGSVTYSLCDWDDLDGEFAPQNYEPVVEDECWVPARAAKVSS